MQGEIWGKLPPDASSHILLPPRSATTVYNLKRPLTLYALSVGKTENESRMNK